MKIKVFDKYCTDGEVRKRNKWELIWCTIYLVASLLCFIGTIIISHYYYIKDSMKGMFAILFFGAVFTLIFVTLVIDSLKKTNGLGSVEFLIHKFDRWDTHSGLYRTLYYMEEVKLFENFIFHKDVGDTIEQKFDEELIKEFDNDESWCLFTTKKDVMKHMLDRINLIISQDKAEAKITIRNISTVEVFSVDELKRIIENGKMDEFIEIKSK